MVLMLIVMAVPAMAEVTQVSGPSDKKTTDTSSSKTKEIAHYYVSGTGADQKIFKISGSSDTFAVDKASLPKDSVEISNELATFALKHTDKLIRNLDFAPGPEFTSENNIGIVVGDMKVQSKNGVSEIFIGDYKWTGSIDKLDSRNDKIYYLGKEVTASGSDGTVVLSVVGKPGVTYTVSGQTAVYDDGSSVKIMDGSGRVYESMTKKEFTALKYDGKISDLGFLSAKFNQQGAQLAGAEKIAGGYVASSAFARDVAISADGKTVIKGDFLMKEIDFAGIQSGDSEIIKKMFDGDEVEINSYVNGELVSRRVYESASSSGQRMSTEYTYSATEWKSVRFATDGTPVPELTRAYKMNHLSDGNILVEITPGVWVNSNDLSVPVDAKTGEALSGENADTQQKTLDELEAKDRDAFNELKKQHMKDNPGELESLLGYWRDVWRNGQKGLFGINFGWVGSVLAIAGELLKGYQQYQGIASLGGLFMKDQIGAWREKVDNAFCKAMLGADCIAQKACEKYGDSANTDIVITTTYPGVGIRSAAYVQAEKSQPSYYSDAEGKHQQYLYRVTFFAASAQEDNSVQLTFNSPGGQFNWYPEPQKISKGGVVSAQGGAAIVKYSTKNYDQVCITYARAIDTGTGGKEKQLCVPIVTSGVTPSGENAPAAPDDAANAPTDATGTDAADPTEDITPEAQAQPGDGF